MGKGERGRYESRTKCIIRRSHGPLLLYGIVWIDRWGGEFLCALFGLLMNGGGTITVEKHCRRERRALMPLHFCVVRQRVDMERRINRKSARGESEEYGRSHFFSVFLHFHPWSSLWIQLSPFLLQFSTKRITIWPGSTDSAMPFPFSLCLFSAIGQAAQSSHPFSFFPIFFQESETDQERVVSHYAEGISIEFNLNRHWNELNRGYSVCLVLSHVSLAQAAMNATVKRNKTDQSAKEKLWVDGKGESSWTKMSSRWTSPLSIIIIPPSSLAQINNWRQSLKRG